MQYVIRLPSAEVKSTIFYKSVQLGGYADDKQYGKNEKSCFWTIQRAGRQSKKSRAQHELTKQKEWWGGGGGREGRGGEKGGEEEKTKKEEEDDGWGGGGRERGEAREDNHQITKNSNTTLCFYIRTRSHKKIST